MPPITERVTPQGYVHADLKNKDYCEWKQFLRDAETWDEERIAEYQLSEIRRVVRHAYANTRSYRALYDKAGILPDDIRSLGHFRRLPFVEKEMIRDDLAGFSTDTEHSEYVTTGGSTGIPFGFYRDRIAFARELASKAYQYHRVGWKEGDRQMVFRGLPIKTKDHTEFIRSFNELRCSSYHLVSEWMDVYRKRAFDYKPDWIRCYPSSGSIFARYLKETRGEFPPLKGILCASENLYDFQRQLLKDVFHCRVFSHYGHYEMAVLAGFCEHEDTYHVLPQYGFAELIGYDGRPVERPGQVGEIVGTSFIMHDTPFVRYRTRDFAVLKGWKCPACIRPYQIWERIEGRLQEYILTGSGRIISMTAINMHDDIFDHIKQFQFHQAERGKVEFLYVPRGTCDESRVRCVRERLLAKLGDDIELGMRPVQEILPTSRGKHRFLVQELILDFPHD